MRAYRSNQWWFLLTCIRGTVFFRIWGRVLFLMMFTTLLILEDKYLTAIPDLSPRGHQLIGIALALLIVFRNNTAYRRFWEGRKLWDQILNHSRNLVRESTVFLKDPKPMANLVVAFVYALRCHLRNEDRFEPHRSLLPVAMQQTTIPLERLPESITLEMTRLVHLETQSGRLPINFAVILESRIAGLTESQGGCEGILKTPLPLAIASLVKQVLFLYLLSLPFILIHEMNGIAIIEVGAIAYALLGIDETASEIENPFDQGENDLPTDLTCEWTEKSVEWCGQYQQSNKQ